MEVQMFDNALEAMHAVKNLANSMDWGYSFEKIFFAYDESRGDYLVTNDNDDLSSEIHQRWCDSGCDSDPQSEADDYHIWEYKLAINKEKYPNTYRNAKKSLIDSKVSLIRKKREIELEYSVSFCISY